MFDQCWPTVYDVGPTLVKHWVDVSCLLGDFQMTTHVAKMKMIELVKHV